MNPRLFAFGCGITRYHYPTWADILGHNNPYYENWAKFGAGNQYIFNSIIECDQVNHFTDQDTVLVMWTAVHRVDYYQFGQWKHLHGLFADSKPGWPLSCPDGYERLSYPLWAAAKSYLEARGVQHQFMTWQPEFDSTTTAAQQYQSTLAQIKPILFDRKTRPYQQLDNKQYVKLCQELYQQLAGPDWPSLESIIANQYQVSENIQQEIDHFLHLVSVDHRIRAQLDLDAHPLPTEHLRIAMTHFPEYTIATDTQTWIQDIEHKLLSGAPFDFKCAEPKYRT